jgi:hypothetical protein
VREGLRAVSFWAVVGECGYGYGGTGSARQPLRSFAEHAQGMLKEC